MRWLPVDLLGFSQGNGDWEKQVQESVYNTMVVIGMLALWSIPQPSDLLCAAGWPTPEGCVSQASVSVGYSWIQPMGVICGLEAREKPGYPPQAASLGVLFLHGSGQLCHAATSTRWPQGWDEITLPPSFALPARAGSSSLLLRISQLTHCSMFGFLALSSLV